MVFDSDARYFPLALNDKLTLALVLNPIRKTLTSATFLTLSINRQSILRVRSCINNDYHAPADTITNIGDIFNFEISQLPISGQTIELVTKACFGKS